MVQILREVIEEWTPGWFYPEGSSQQYRLTVVAGLNLIKVEPKYFGDHAKTFAFDVTVRQLG